MRRAERLLEDLHDHATELLSTRNDPDHFAYVMASLDEAADGAGDYLRDVTPVRPDDAEPIVGHLRHDLDAIEDAVAHRRDNTARLLRLVERLETDAAALRAALAAERYRRQTRKARQ